MPSSPVEPAPSESSVKKLQAFFAQGEPIRKEALIRLAITNKSTQSFIILNVLFPKKR